MSLRYQLKEHYAGLILQKAKLEFGEEYLSALSRQLKSEQNRDFYDKEISSALEGESSTFPLLDALCKHASISWEEAVLDPNTRASSFTSEISKLQRSFNIEEIIRTISKRISFSFEKETHSFMQKPFGEWLKESFIPVELTEVNILPSQYPVFDKEELLGNSSEDEFDRLGIQHLHGKRIDCIRILEEKKNIFVYGDPGSGKSSYLQWIALQCRAGNLLQEYLPLFLEMRHFPILGAGATLTTHFMTSFEKIGVKPIELSKILAAGKGVFILDGVDEIHKSDRSRIETIIRKLLVDHEKCLFIFSSRLGFDLSLPNLQKVVVSPFHSGKHIPKFVERWFSDVEDGINRSSIMLDKLRSPRYRGISEISRRPVLLKLLCFIFQKYDEFPIKRVDVFQMGIDELVKQSQSSIYIETGIRDIPELTSRDITNILCRLAKHFFIDLGGDILFNIREVGRIIDRYIYDTYNSNIVDANHVIKIIEQHNGLLVRWGSNYCSFSHLTYQEFFVAKYLVDENEQDLVYENITNPRWSFIIGLVAELLPQEKVSFFFHGFKHRLDSVINHDPKVSNLVLSVDSTSSIAIHATKAAAPFTKVLIRAWYLIYAIGEYRSKMHGIFINPRKRLLPDMIYATSMIENDVLNAHAIIYDLYHCMTEEDPHLLLVLVNDAIRFFQAKDQGTASILATWLTQIHNQQDRFNGDVSYWWNDRVIRRRWRERVIDLMRSLAVPCPSEFQLEQAHLLKEYYTATHLFSVCINRSEVGIDDYQSFSDALLSIEHLPPEKVTGNFVGF